MCTCDACGFGDQLSIFNVDRICDDCWDKFNSWFIEKNIEGW